jgi:ABC-type multidrug transport system ATPase subunit
MEADSFLDNGNIVAQDTPLGLTKKIPEATLVLVFDGKRKDLEKYLVEKKYKFHFSNESRVEITTTEKEIAGIIFGISKTNIWITDIEVHKPTLEDVFLQIARRTV